MIVWEVDWYASAMRQVAWLVGSITLAMLIVMLLEYIFGE